MGSGSLDTLAVARRLQAAGFTDVQAVTVTGALRDARETDLSALATKANLAAVKGDLRTEIAETKYEILRRVLSAIGFRTIVIVGAIVAPTKGLR